MKRNDYEQKSRLWDQLRSAMQHENDLVNHRITWFISFQSFLITGFLVAQATILSKPVVGRAMRVTEFFLFLLMVAAARVSMITAFNISAAFEQIEGFANFWDMHGESNPSQERWTTWKGLSWTAKYVGKEQHLPVKNWFYKQLARAGWRVNRDRTGMPMAWSMFPTFPPIRGHKLHFISIAKTEGIPRVFLWVNVVAGFACLAMIVFVTDRSDISDHEPNIVVSVNGAQSRSEDNPARGAKEQISLSAHSTTSSAAIAQGTKLAISNQKNNSLTSSAPKGKTIHRKRKQAEPDS